MRKLVLTCTNSKGTCIYPAMSEADLTQRRVKINGVSINNMYYFYQLLDKLMDRVYNELLLTNKHVYINEFRYMEHYRLLLTYEHVLTQEMHQYEHLININDNYKESFECMKTNIKTIFQSASSFGDTMFAPLL